MSDDRVRVVLVFFKEFFRAGERYLVYVSVYILRIHADSVIRHGERAFFLVDRDFYIHFSTLELAKRGKRLQLLSRVYSIGYELTQKYFMIAV